MLLESMADDKRLDFHAPLQSVRRFSCPAVLETAALAPANCRRRTSLPFYKSDIKSGPVGRPGIVPFLWEQTPGCPKDGGAAKSVRTRPPTVPTPPSGQVSKEPEHVDYASDSTNENSIEVFTNPPKIDIDEAIDAKPVQTNSIENWEEDNEDLFSDAWDSLSRTGSCAINCSISGLSEGVDAAELAGRSLADPQALDFMIGRFLPAAQAMASTSRHCASRKQFSTTTELTKPVTERLHRPLAKQNNINPNNYVVNYALELGLQNNYDNDEEEEEEVEEYDRSSCMASKGCGLLPRFCLKGSFGLLNPVPGIKAPGLVPRKYPKSYRYQNKSLQQNSLRQIGNEKSWEAMYKQRLGRGDVPPMDDQSSLTSESNHLTYWSDSPTPDGTSPYQRFGGGISPNRNEASQSPFHGGRVFLATPSSGKKSYDFSEKGENYWEATHSSLKGSGSNSSGVQRSLSLDSVLSPTFPSKGVDNQKGERRDTVEAFETNAIQLSDSKHVHPYVSISLKKSNCEDTIDKSSKQTGCIDNLSLMEVQKQEQCEVSLEQLLLPPPLPRSPSESWLWRTSPSGSSKNPSSQSFLGLHVQARRKPPKESARKSGSKPSTTHRQSRFAGAITKPDPPRSEA